MQFSFNRFFFFSASMAMFFVFLYFSRELMVPLAYALLISFILYPVCRFLERWGVGRIPAIILSMLMVFLLVSGGLVLFSTQIVKLSTELTDFGSKLMSMFTQVIVFINDNIPVINDLNSDSLLEEGTKLLEESWQGMATETFGGMISFFSGAVLVIIYTFLILLYRGGIVKALRGAAPKENEENVTQLISDIQNVGKSYLVGMVLLMIILGTISSLGLWIIGIDYPFLFGYLAGVLVIIPYIGTLVGGLLPTVYALMTHDSLWVPVAVVGLFWLVQILEGNYLSPKILGGKLSLNAFTAIFSLILGGSIWGISGMVLFLPFASIMKVTFGHLEPLKPVARLMGDTLYTPDKDKPGFFKTVREKLRKKS